MNVEVKLDAAYEEPLVVIHTKTITDDVQQLIERIRGNEKQFLTGLYDYRVEIIEPDSLIRIFALDGKVYALTDTKKYTLKFKLYELEHLLNNQFVRISNSEIINLRKVLRFDVSLAGTISVEFKDKTKTFVSRRYVKQIKKTLGL